MRNNCYDCKHRRDIPGNAHSKCVHPQVSTLNVEGSPHGIRNGWFCFPYNFDPFWLNECDGFEKKVCEGELDEDDRCAECSAKAAAYDEMVDRVKDALSTPIDMIQIAKQIITKPKGE